MESSAPVRKFEVLVPFALSADARPLELGAIVSIDLFTAEDLEVRVRDGFLVEVTEHVVTEEDIAANPDAGLVLGETITLPVPKAEADLTEEEKAQRDAAEEEIAKAAAEKEAEEKAAADKAAEEAAQAESQVAAAPTGTPYVYGGKKVIRDTSRNVNGRDYHHIQLETGESLDLGDAEYDAMVEASKTA